MYSISYENRPSHLFAHIEGPESYKNAVHFWKELTLKATEMDHNNILVLDEVSGRLSTINLFKVGEIISELFVGKRIAFVDPKEDTFADNKFGETVILNRGGRVVLFHSVKEAEKWLLQS